MQPQPRRRKHSQEAYAPSQPSLLLANIYPHCTTTTLTTYHRKSLSTVEVMTSRC